ncbi:MAG: HAD hydrolase-like protein [Chitinophagales bacterium]|nr:HAD hydrolase-like protein [Chitinophagales bacterium]
MRKFDAIIFDLDGTVIDSVPGIQRGYDLAYEKILNRKNEEAITPFIGPPIGDIFRQLTNIEDDKVIQDFIEQFQLFYDRDGYKEAKIYEGMEAVLIGLQQAEIDVYLATYKREIPTRKILVQMDLLKYFQAIYTVDMYGYRFSNKSEMVQDLVIKHQLQPTRCLFVGDTVYDKRAAMENKMLFAWAKYGYGSDCGSDFDIHSPIDILSAI